MCCSGLTIFPTERFAKITGFMFMTIHLQDSAQPVPNFTLLSCDVDLEAMQTMDFATRSAAPMTQTPPVLLDQVGMEAILQYGR